MHGSLIFDNSGARGGIRHRQSRHGGRRETQSPKRFLAPARAQLTTMCHMSGGGTPDARIYFTFRSLVCLPRVIHHTRNNAVKIGWRWRIKKGETCRFDATPPPVCVIKYIKNEWKNAEVRPQIKSPKSRQFSIPRAPQSCQVMMGEICVGKIRIAVR